MSEIQAREIADAADVIVNGYAMSRLWYHTWRRLPCLCKDFAL